MTNPPLLILLIPIVLLVLLSLIPLLSRPSARSDGGRWRGIFYVNPDDPALFVPKRFGIGYTLNFGNRLSWFVLALILILVFLPLVLAMEAVRHGPKFH
jgi:uncharacterized membrane protein